MFQNTEVVCLSYDYMVTHISGDLFQELLRDYHVDADVAFFLHRPVLAQKIAAKCEYLRKNSEVKSSNLEKTIERYTTAAKDSLEPILHAITPLLPSRVWEDISPEFYVTFW